MAGVTYMIPMGKEFLFVTLLSFFHNFIATIVKIVSNAI